MNNENPFRNFTLTDDEVMTIIDKYMPVINKYSRIDGVLDEDCKQEIMIAIFTKLTKNKKK